MYLSELNKEQMADRIDMPYKFCSQNTNEKNALFQLKKNKKIKIKGGFRII